MTHRKDSAAASAVAAVTAVIIFALIPGTSPSMPDARFVNRDDNDDAGRPAFNAALETSGGVRSASLFARMVV